MQSQVFPGTLPPIVQKRHACVYIRERRHRDFDVGSEDTEGDELGGRAPAGNVDEHVTRL